MNVVLTVIFVFEIATSITRTKAYPNWSWSVENNHKPWNHHHSETYHSCAIGHCVKAWNCPQHALVAESEKDSCIYKENGPWVCCLECDGNSHYWGDDHTPINTPKSPNNFKYNTVRFISTTASTQIHVYNKYDGTHKPVLKTSRNKNEKDESHVRPLGDILKNTVHTAKNKTTGTNITNSILVNKSTENSIYKRTTKSWHNSHTSTQSPNYYKRTTNLWNKPSTTTSTNYNKKVTNLWDKPRSTESGIFPTKRTTKRITSSPPTKRIANSESTKRSWIQPTSTEASWRYTTPYAKRTHSTTTKHLYSKQSTVPTKAATQKRNHSWGSSTTAHPTRSQTVTTKTTRPSSNRFTTKSTRRYSVTTPLPNVNMHLCGIRVERKINRRQKRDGNYGRNPFIVDAEYSGNSHSRGRLPYQRIVGGEEAEPFSWPWVAALYKVTSSGGNRFLSAGSLINENFILTAAHVFTPDDLRTASYVAMLGTHDAQDAVAQYIVSSVLLHPNYEHRYYYNDIALLKLEKKVVFNNYIMPVCLPSPKAPLHSDKDLLGKNVTVMGWGDDSFGGKSSQVLKEASFPIQSRVSCNASYVRVASNRFPKGITADMLCAGDPKGGKDACQGDSGGPLTVIENGRHTQVGIVSFGYKCGDKEFPGVYTKVAPFLSWIAENTKYVDSLDYEYYQ